MEIFILVIIILFLILASIINYYNITLDYIVGYRFNYVVLNYTVKNKENQLTRHTKILLKYDKYVSK
jgi:hypothetical protein|nr:MAG TPA: hypothetical protein [Crassvirales sp.]